MARKYSRTLIQYLGFGPRINRIFEEAGIKTLYDFSRLSPDQIEDILMADDDNMNHLNWQLAAFMEEKTQRRITDMYVKPSRIGWALREFGIQTISDLLKWDKQKLVQVVPGFSNKDADEITLVLACHYGIRWE